MGLNGIFLPQANVKIVSRGEREITKINGKAVNFDQPYFLMERATRVPAHYQRFNWTDLAAEKQGGGGVINIFCVRKPEDDNDPTTVLYEEARHVHGMLILNDNSGPNRFGTLAHEIGHAMGCKHDKDANSLMCEGPLAFDNATRIRKAHVNVMNRD